MNTRIKIKMPSISNHILQKREEKQKETLKRFCDLPYDLQCVILSKMEKNEQRRLSWTSPLTITQRFTGSCRPVEPIFDLLMESNIFDFNFSDPNEGEGEGEGEGEASSSHNDTRSKKGKGPRSLFSIEATFHCDANGFIWMNTKIYWSVWINSMYFFKNVPIGSARGIRRTSHVGAKEIARLMKRAFFEFVAYTYAWGGPTFKRATTSEFELASQDHVVNVGPKLRIDDVHQWIKREWFNAADIGSTWYERPKPAEFIEPFSVEDGIRGFDRSNIRIPYALGDLINLKEICPHIYRHLERYGELKSPITSRLPPSIQEYICLYKKLVSGNANEEKEQIKTRLWQILEQNFKYRRMFIFNQMEEEEEGGDGGGGEDRLLTIEQLFAHISSYLS